jgi:hypothetical protein
VEFPSMYLLYFNVQLNQSKVAASELCLNIAPFL